MYKLEGFKNEFLYVLPDALLDRLSTIPRLKQLYVTDLGYYPKARYHHVHRDLGTEEWILIFCTAGKGAVFTPEHSWDMTRGSLVLLPPNKEHTYQASEERPWSIFWVHFRGSQVTEYLPSPEAYFQSVLRDDDFNEITDLFWKMIRTFAGSYSDQASFYVTSLLINLLAYLALSNQLTSTQRVTANAYVSQTIQYIYNHMDQKIHTAQISHDLGISDSYLSRLFHNSLNKSITEFITETKIKQACHYLQYTDLPVQQIAQQVGYNDQFYFSRVFKKYVKISPRQFRQNKIE